MGGGFFGNTKISSLVGGNYYLILDTQLGREGSSYIDTTKLPVELRVDYVRYYELDTKTDVIPEPKEYQQFDTKKKRLRKVVYDTKTHFDNPDEYRLAVYKSGLEVTESVNSKLQIGDTFHCGCFIVGQPLYLYDFKHGDEPASVFVVGKRGGLGEVKLRKEPRL